MNSARDFFKDKRITVMGLGVLGRGVGDVLFLAGCGAKLTVTDLKPAEELAPSLSRLEGYDITYVLGEHRLENFQTCDMVIKAAGVPLDSPYIAEARRHDIPVYMSTALAVYLSEAQTIGVTGTRGKSIVTQLIYEGLRRKNDRVVLGGNVRGTSTLAQLPEITADHTWVLELDSWQLQGFRDLGISPNIAVFTTFMRDHMDYYRDDMGAYFKDKAAIFEFQKDEDALIAGSEIAGRIQDHGPPALPEEPELLPATWFVPIPGAHNLQNAALARAALRRAGLEDEEIRAAFADFEGLEGRLELIDEIRGLKIYNDSNATTPEAATAALKSFESGRVVLIAGGADKGLELEQLADVIRSTCRATLLLAGTGTDRLSKLLPEASVLDSLEEAVNQAFKAAHTGDVILLSPGFASFGMFKNEYDRGDQFKELVHRHRTNMIE